mmetsp:Transcript_116140/g.182711  ORF Transcript_116140/g.182711 Transcript_116140/m.182711 type:complete len:206 (+) Transcript_116140:84-701(+)
MAARVLAAIFVRTVLHVAGHEASDRDANSSAMVIQSDEPDWVISGRQRLSDDLFHSEQAPDIMHPYKTVQDKIKAADPELRQYAKALTDAGNKMATIYDLLEKQISAYQAALRTAVRHAHQSDINADVMLGEESYALLLRNAERYKPIVLADKVATEMEPTRKADDAQENDENYIAVQLRKGKPADLHGWQKAVDWIDGSPIEKN